MENKQEINTHTKKNKQQNLDTTPDSDITLKFILHLERQLAEKDAKILRLQQKNRDLKQNNKSNQQPQSRQFAQPMPQTQPMQQMQPIPSTQQPQPNRQNQYNRPNQNNRSSASFFDQHPMSNSNKIEKTNPQPWRSPPPKEHKYNNPNHNSRNKNATKAINTTYEKNDDFSVAKLQTSLQSPIQSPDPDVVDNQ